MKLRGASLAVLPALLTGLLPLAQAGALQATFTYPTQKGLKFYEQDTVQVSYQSNISNASLWVFCLEGDNGAILKTKKIIWNTGGGDGSQEIVIDFQTNSNTCWFNLRDNVGEAHEGANSVEFALSASQRSQTTLGLHVSATTSAATTSVASTSAASTPSHTPTTASTSTAPQATASDNVTPGNGGGSSGGALSTGAKVGIGVGVALGVLGLLELVGIFWMVRRRKARAASDSKPGAGGGGVNGYWKPEMDAGGVKKPMPLPQQQQQHYDGGRDFHPGQVSEVDGRAGPQELPG